MWTFRFMVMMIKRPKVSNNKPMWLCLVSKRNLFNACEGKYCNRFVLEKHIALILTAGFNLDKRLELSGFCKCCEHCEG